MQAGAIIRTFDMYCFI